jgi:hypothetical protein
MVAVVFTMAASAGKTGETATTRPTMAKTKLTFLN